MRCAHCRTGPSNGSAPAIVCSGVPSTGHFSGSTTSSAPADAAARVNRSAVSRLRSRSGVDCNWTAAARTKALLPRRTDPSVNRAYRSAAMALRKSWRWVGAFGPGRDALHRARARRCAAPLVVGGVGRRAAARGHARPVRPDAGAGYADRGDDRPGVDAQDAAAGDGHRAGPRDRPARPARRVRRPPRAAGRRGCGRRERAWRSRARRSSGTSSTACTTARPRSAPCGSTACRTRWTRSRSTGSTASATCASRRSPRARSTRTTCCSSPTTSSRSARSRARCRSRGPLRTGWGVMERHEALW